MEILLLATEKCKYHENIILLLESSASCQSSNSSLLIINREISVQMTPLHAGLMNVKIVKMLLYSKVNFLPHFLISIVVMQVLMYQWI